MSCRHGRILGQPFFLMIGGDYKPGDQAPTGYIAWQEWAEVQHKAGLRQVECGLCAKWQYPQELSTYVHTFTANTRRDGRGKAVTVERPVLQQVQRASGSRQRVWTGRTPPNHDAFRS